MPSSSTTKDNAHNERRSGIGHYPEAALLSVTVAPTDTCRNSVASPSTRPTTLTGLAARGFSSLLAGVGPKKMHRALPTGQ
jgi:hypothetical protein